MNVNITGIYDNTVIVDSNLFDDVRLLQTGLSSLSDTLYSVVQGLPYEYANLTAFTTLSEPAPFNVSGSGKQLLNCRANSCQRMLPSGIEPE